MWSGGHQDTAGGKSVSESLVERIGSSPNAEDGDGFMHPKEIGPAQAVRSVSGASLKAYRPTLLNGVQ